MSRRRWVWILVAVAVLALALMVWAGGDALWRLLVALHGKRP